MAAPTFDRAWRASAWLLASGVLGCGNVSIDDVVDAGRTPEDGGLAIDAGGRDAGAPAPDAGELDGGFDPICPPTGPYSSQLGGILPDVQLTDCAGNPQSLHALCEKKAAYLFVYADW